MCFVPVAADGCLSTVDDDFGTRDHKAEQRPFSVCAGLPANMGSVVESDVAVDLDESTFVFLDKPPGYI